MVDGNQALMSPNAKPVAGALDLIGQAWKIFSQKWKKLFWFLLFFPVVIALLTLLLSMASASFSVVIASDGMAMGLKILFSILLGAAVVLGTLITIYFSIVINAAAVYVVAQDMSPRDAFKKGREIFWKFFGWAILFGIIIAVGFIVFVIPGIILLVMLSFSIFAVTLEGLGPVKALKRSKELVKGFWWTLFARLFVLCIFVIVLSAISNSLSTAGTSLFAYSGRGIFTLILAVILAILVWAVSFIINFAISAVSLVYTYLLYKKVKEIKEKDPSATDKMSGGKKAGLVILMIAILAAVIVGFVLAMSAMA